MTRARDLLYAASTAFLGVAIGVVALVVWEAACR